MSTCLLAALSADAVINHRVTGWQCPSLTSAWLRRARFLPARQRKQWAAKGCWLWKRCFRTAAKSCTFNNSNFQYPFPCRGTTKAFCKPASWDSRNVQALLFWNFPICQPLEALVLGSGWTSQQQAQHVVWLPDTQALETCGTAADFLEEGLLLFWARLFAAPWGIKNTVATIEFWYF